MKLRTLFLPLVGVVIVKKDLRYSYRTNVEQIGRVETILNINDNKKTAELDFFFQGDDVISLLSGSVAIEAQCCSWKRVVRKVLFC